MRTAIGWAVAIGVIAGTLLYGFRCYQVLQAGGLSQPISIRPSCVSAVTGNENSGYRRGEHVQIARHYLPPTATCVWSSGARDVLIRPNALSWGGPVLLGLGLLGGLGLGLTRPRRGR